MDACPPLEDIAAFLDGKLPAEERARITEHLARCESCYEIFAGAVHFQEEERASSAKDTSGGDVIEFPLAQEKVQEKQVRAEPARPPRRASWWLPLAASVVLAAGLGYMIWQNSRVLPEVTVASLAEPLEEKPQLVEYLFQPEDVPRGNDETEPLSEPYPAFLVGVYLLDLHLSVDAGDVVKTQHVLYDLQTKLSEVPFMQGQADDFKKEADQMTGPAALARLARTLPQRESALQNQLSEDPFFRFGLWSEAGRISALTGSSSFFERRANRRFLSAIQREIRPEDDERYLPIQKNLRNIEALLERGERRDYTELARLFRSNIDQIEQIQREDQDELRDTIVDRPLSP